MLSLKMQWMMHLFINDMMKMQCSSNLDCALLNSYKAFVLHECAIVKAGRQGTP